MEPFSDRSDLDFRESTNWVLIGVVVSIPLALLLSSYGITFEWVFLIVILVFTLTVIGIDWLFDVPV